MVRHRGDLQTPAERADAGHGLSHLRDAQTAVLDDPQALLADARGFSEVGEADAAPAAQPGDSVSAGPGPRLAA